MKIYNKSSQIQELRVYDRNTNRPHSIYVLSHGFTVIDAHISVPDLPKLVSAGIFQILEEEKTRQCSEGCACSDSVVTPDLVEETGDVVDSSESTPDAIVAPEESTPASTPDLEDNEEGTLEESNEEEVTKFVCDICGGEFASARGLARHKSMSHES